MKPESSYSLGGLLGDKDELAAVPQPRDKVTCFYLVSAKNIVSYQFEGPL